MTEQQEKRYECYKKCRELIMEFDEIEDFVEISALISSDVVWALNQHMKNGEKILFDKIMRLSEIERD